MKTDGGMRVELALILAACSALQFINPVFGVTAVVVLAAIAALVVVWNSAFGRRFRLRLLAVRGLPSRLQTTARKPWLRWPSRLRPCACIAQESVTIVGMTSCTSTSGVCASGRAFSPIKNSGSRTPPAHRGAQRSAKRRFSTDRHPCKSSVKEKHGCSGALGRARTFRMQNRSARILPLGGGSCLRRTRHPFAVSGPKAVTED